MNIFEQVLIDAQQERKRRLLARANYRAAHYPKSEQEIRAEAKAKLHQLAQDLFEDDVPIRKKRREL